MSLLSSLSLGNYKESEPKAYEKKVTKFFSPGEYDLKVLEAELTDAVCKDPSWKQLALKLCDAEEIKSVRVWVQFPTESLDYTGTTEKGAKFNVDTLLAVVRAFGYSTATSSLVASIAAVFENPSKLVGKTVKVKIGYRGNHLEKVGGQWTLVDYKGAKVPGAPSAESLEDMKGLLESKAIKYSAFPEIVSWLSKAPKVKKEAF